MEYGGVLGYVQEDPQLDRVGQKPVLVDTGTESFTGHCHEWRSRRGWHSSEGCN